jgi:hypothetical protein
MTTSRNPTTSGGYNPYAEARLPRTARDEAVRGTPPGSVVIVAEFLRASSAIFGVVMQQTTS